MIPILGALQDGTLVKVEVPVLAAVSEHFADIPGAHTIEEDKGTEDLGVALCFGDAQGPHSESG